MKYPDENRDPNKCRYTMRYILVAFLFISFLACKEVKTEQSVSDTSVLLDVFRASKSDYPKISVHRGGKGIINYPENCLETIKYVSDSIKAIYEIDIAQTKDGKLVLMHDNSLERTTTGSGLVKDHTYDELQEFNLVDDYGNETNYKIPLFSKVLEWCKANKVILTVDIKRSVSQSVVIEAIKKANAEDVCVIITYDLNQAKSSYALAPELLISVSARNDEELNRLLASEIPTKNMLAFTGTRLSNPNLYKRLKDKDIVAMLGTLGNLDKQAEARGNHLYNEWMSKGVNILATDRPFEVQKAIQK